MKFDLELENEIGCVSITLERDFIEGEIESIVKVAKGLLRKNSLVNDEGSPVTWGEEHVYYELTFQNPENKITAIKAVREAIQCGLKEAKDIVEGTMRCPPLSVFNAKAVREVLERNGVKDFLLQIK